MFSQRVITPTLYKGGGPVYLCITEQTGLHFGCVARTAAGSARIEGGEFRRNEHVRICDATRLLAHLEALLLLECQLRFPSRLELGRRNPTETEGIRRKAIYPAPYDANAHGPRWLGAAREHLLRFFALRARACTALYVNRNNEIYRGFPCSVQSTA